MVAMVAQAHGFFKQVGRKPCYFQLSLAVAIETESAYNPVGFVVRCLCDT
jgi:hypothetical protein